MAGDWIKMRTGLRNHPKVVRISSALLADRFRVIGGLHAVWCVFDEFSDDGMLNGYSAFTLDETIGWQGFSDAMALVGWLTISEQGIECPEFLTHNGASAKRRAADKDRKKDVRIASGQTSASKADKLRTREENKKQHLEQELPPLSPKQPELIAADTPTPPKIGKRVVSPAKRRGEPDLFADFYALYPRKVGRPKAAQSFGRLTEADQRAAIAAVPAFAASWKWRMEPDFIPHPTTWLNQERWKDDPPPPHPSAPAARQPHAPKQSRQNAIFEVLANDHRYAETAARLAAGQPPQGLLAAHPAESGLHARAGHGSNDADCLDADFSEQGHR